MLSREVLGLKLQKVKNSKKFPFLWLGKKTRHRITFYSVLLPSPAKYISNINKTSENLAHYKIDCKQTYKRANEPTRLKPLVPPERFQGQIS